MGHKYPMRNFINLLEHISLADKIETFNGIVYHCSNERFSQFRMEPTRGVYFANEPDSEYGKFIYRCRVQLTNCAYSSSGSNFEIDRNILIENGFDGRIVDYEDEINEGEVMFDVVAFHPHQIEILEVTERTELKEFAEPDTDWFAGSKVVDRHKNPLVCFHAGNQDIEHFWPMTHFGTAVAANQRADFKYGVHGSRSYPVYLNIKNPLRVTDTEASDEGALTNAIARGAYPDISIGVARQKGPIVACELAGYDGLVYRNEMEHRGRRSWVIFRPEQARFAIDRTHLNEHYTREELESMDIDDLDRMAFGYVGDQIVQLDPDQIKLKPNWNDIENAEYKYKLWGMDWVRSVSFEEPVEVSVNNDGVLELEDGHHRWFAAKKLGLPLKAVIEIKGKPIERLLAMQDRAEK